MITRTGGLLLLAGTAVTAIALVTTAVWGRENHNAGREMFLQAGCGGCHTLRDAHAVGTAAPNLDLADPEKQKVTNWVTGGAAGMPAYKNTLTPDQISLIAAYVASVSGR